MTGAQGGTSKLWKGPTSTTELSPVLRTLTKMTVVWKLRPLRLSEKQFVTHGPS